jgi:hypothetical protein
MKLPRGIYDRKGILYIRFQDGKGQICRESTHQSSIRIAQEILAKRKTEVAEGTYFPARRFERVVFSELAEKWWEGHGQYTRSCFRYLRNRIDRQFGSLRARDVEVPAIRTFFAELERRGYSPAYINSHRTMLNSIFNYAIKNREYDRNPIESIPQLRERERTRLVSIEEWQRLLPRAAMFRRARGRYHDEEIRNPPPALAGSASRWKFPLFPNSDYEE